MILTYKIRHDRDFTHELKLAKKIAKYAIKTKSRSSADVKHIGLKSAISNQILKKYSSSETAKQAKSVKLTVPAQGIKIKDDQAHIACLKLKLPIYFPINFKKINIAFAYQNGISRFVKDRDLAKGSTDAPREALV